MAPNAKRCVQARFRSGSVFRRYGVGVVLVGQVHEGHLAPHLHVGVQECNLHSEEAAALSSSCNFSRIESSIVALVCASVLVRGFQGRKKKIKRLEGRCAKFRARVQRGRNSMRRILLRKGAKIVGRMLGWGGLWGDISVVNV